MVRLKPGEYQQMTPEQQREHRKKLRNRWLRKAGNRARVREWNKRYYHGYWETRKEKPTIRVCSRCGQTVVLTGKRTICDECKAIPSKTRLLREENQRRQEEKAKIRLDRISQVIDLALTTDLSQKEIAERTGTHQPVVSKILIQYHIRRPNR